MLDTEDRGRNEMMMDAMAAGDDEKMKDVMGW